MTESLQIVVPMAGLGSRFARAGYAQPKPLIPVFGRPMIQLVVENLTPERPHHFIFVVQQAHRAEFGLDAVLGAAASSVSVIGIDGLTEGAACTVLAAREALDLDAPLMIANCDQYVDTDIETYLGAIDSAGADGGIMTMPSDDPKWSYARVGASGYVVDVVEKQVVSPHATVGIYNFGRAGDFVDAADAMIEVGDRVNGEFYVAPTYNRLIRAGSTIVPIDVGPAMWGLGIPRDLEDFLAGGPLTPEVVHV